VPFALHAGRHATQLTDIVTFYTNGSTELASTFEAPTASTPQMIIDSRKIKKLVKSGKKSEITIHFEDGTEKVEAFLGAAPRTSLRGKFAEQLGLEKGPNGDIVTKPPFFQTSVKGVFAAGDNSSPMKIVATALATGSSAGGGASGQIIAERLGQPSMV